MQILGIKKRQIYQEPIPGYRSVVDLALTAVVVAGALLMHPSPILLTRRW